MKAHYVSLLISITVLIQFNAFAQTGPTLEFTYDAAGNRIKREIIYLSKSVIDTATITNVNDTSQVVSDAQNSNTETTGNNGQAANNGQTSGSNQFAATLGGQQIVIYPNPTTGKLQVKITPFNTGLQAEIIFYDSQSRLLFRQPAKKELTTVDLSKYATGSYIMEITIGSKSNEWKIVKQ